MDIIVELVKRLLKFQNDEDVKCESDSDYNGLYYFVTAMEDSIEYMYDLLKKQLLIDIENNNKSIQHSLLDKLFIYKVDYFIPFNEFKIY